jgi:hypothetical protein
VRTVEPTAVVRFEEAEILFEEGAVHTVGREIHRLIEEGGHVRLVVNFAGVSPPLLLDHPPQRLTAGRAAERCRLKLSAERAGPEKYVCTVWTRKAHR